jgi:hypothetical protein
MSVLVAAFLHPAVANGRVLALAGERYELCLSTGILANEPTNVTFVGPYGGRHSVAFIVFGQHCSFPSDFPQIRGVFALPAPRRRDSQATTLGT